MRSCKSSDSLEWPKAVSESSVWYRERKSRFTLDKGMVLVPGPRLKRISFKPCFTCVLWQNHRENLVILFKIIDF